MHAGLCLHHKVQHPGLLQLRGSRTSSLQMIMRRHSRLTTNALSRMKIEAGYTVAICTSSQPMCPCANIGAINAVQSRSEVSLEGQQSVGLGSEFLGLQQVHVCPPAGSQGKRQTGAYPPRSYATAEPQCSPSSVPGCRERRPASSPFAAGQSVPWCDRRTQSREGAEYVPGLSLATVCSRLLLPSSRSESTRQAGAFTTQVAEQMAPQRYRRLQCTSERLVKPLHPHSASARIAAGIAARIATTSVPRHSTRDRSWCQ